jgi:two-component system sensor histidine kinase VanS
LATKLRSEKKQGPDYKFLEWKLFLKLALITIAALVVVFVLQNFARGEFGDFTVQMMQTVFSITERHALGIYNRVIRSNINLILVGTVAVFFIILSRFLLSHLSKYFREISDGLDVLVGNKDTEIKLSPEMEAMERKLKTIKQTLEEREQEAKQAEQRKNELVMYLAHDIKTPLTSVVGYLSLLDEVPDMPMEQKAKYVHITLDKAYRLEQLIDEFFEITRYNLQTIALSKKNIDLYYMLVQMADEFYPQLCANGKQVAVHASEELTVNGDPDKLARVFNNILKNAVSYSLDNSVIDISAVVSGNMVTIAFTNTGSIPKDKLVSIFDQFYRLDSARSSEVGGAGLGLSIAKEIIALHGGRIYADSDDKKTSFTVELPIVPEQS